jgi:hypothetical protein
MRSRRVLRPVKIGLLKRNQATIAAAYFDEAKDSHNQGVQLFLQVRTGHADIVSRFRTLI